MNFVLLQYLNSDLCCYLNLTCSFFRFFSCEGFSSWFWGDFFPARWFDIDFSLQKQRKTTQTNQRQTKANPIRNPNPTKSYSFVEVKCKTNKTFFSSVYGCSSCQLGCYWCCLGDLMAAMMTRGSLNLAETGRHRALLSTREWKTS